MARTTRYLLVKVEQAGKVELHRLSGGGRVTIGQHPGNDITVYGRQFPKKHVLITGRNDRFRLSLQPYMQGEVTAGESRLAFGDLLQHGLLPRKGDSFTYPLSADKSGHLTCGDATVSFQFVDARESPDKLRKKFIGYSWAYATFRHVGREVQFKAIFLFFLLLTVFTLNYMKKLPTDFRDKLATAQVPERLARIIVHNPQEPASETRPAALGREERGAEEESEQPESASGSRGNPRPESQGLLGLLTGTGASEQASSLADFLLDKDLVDEIDQAISSPELTVGNGTGIGDDLDDLIAASESETGIDDLLGDFDEIESVSLGEKGQIQVDKIGSITGTEGALGKRSEDSVRSVLLAYTGRLTYIYNKYLKHNPDLNGKMVVEVVIAASGAVSAVKLVTSSMNHPEFEREVLNLIGRWKYPPIDQGSVTVTYPLFFNKIG